MAHNLYLSTLLLMKLSIFNRPFIICNSFMILISNEFDLPYIMVHVICEMH